MFIKDTTSIYKHVYILKNIYVFSFNKDLLLKKASWEVIKRTCLFYDSVAILDTTITYMLTKLCSNPPRSYVDCKSLALPSHYKHMFQPSMNPKPHN